MSRRLLVLVTVLLGCESANAQMKFVLKLGPDINRKRVFEAALVPGIDKIDPTQIYEVVHTQFLSQDLGNRTPQELTAKVVEDRLKGYVTVAPGNAAIAVIGRCINGVRGEVLDTYYPKAIAGDPEQINKLDPFPDIALEIVPRFKGDVLELFVYHHGEPLPGCPVDVIDRSGPSQGRADETRLITDENGRVEWEIPADGTYTAYARFEDKQPGQVINSQKYNYSLHSASLTFSVPLEEEGFKALTHKVRQATVQNLLGPLVLFFFFGFLARLLGSPIRFPAEAYQVIVIFLLLSIGYEGGHELRAEKHLLHALLPLGVGFVVNTLVSILAVFLLLKVFRFDTANSCALGALYGSDSAGLYAVALALVNSFHLPKEGYMAAMLAVMEIPGVLVGIILYRILAPQPHTHGLQPDPAGGHPPESREHGKTGLIGVFFHELKSPGVLLLLGGILVGYLTVPTEYVKTEPFFIIPFKGIMCLFLFENGLKAGEQVSALRKGAVKLVLFGAGFPLAMGILTILLARYGLQMSSGSAVLFAILVAAPSNIAAPAAMRLAIPEANPSIYFTTGLAISFPTLVVLGVPLFYLMTQLVY